MKVKNFVQKVEEIKNKNSLDLGAWEDLSIGLMNIISLEEHAFFSYVKTKDKKFLAILESVREMRKRLLAKIVRGDDGSEKWCMSKHLLASSMRMFEVGNRMLHEGNNEEAERFYSDSAELYGMFWEINSGKEPKIKKDEKEGIFSSIKNFLECCKE